MIFCNNTIYGKVWKINKQDKYLDLQMTTSEKGQDGAYINSGWFPRVIGHAFNTLKDTLKEGDRIVITKCKFTNERYKANDGTTKSAFRFLILEATIDTPEGSRAASAQRTEPAVAATPTVAASGDDCPW